MWTTSKIAVWLTVGVLYTVTCSAYANHGPESNSQEMDEYAGKNALESAPDAKIYESDIDQELQKRLARLMTIKDIANRMKDAEAQEDSEEQDDEDVPENLSEYEQVFSQDDDEKPIESEPQDEDEQLAESMDEELEESVPQDEDEQLAKSMSEDTIREYEAAHAQDDDIDDEQDEPMDEEDTMKEYEKALAEEEPMTEDDSSESLDELEDISEFQSTDYEDAEDQDYEEDSQDHSDPDAANAQDDDSAEAQSAYLYGSRYVGVGYNLIYASPEGVGSNYNSYSGFRVNRRVFALSYSKRKQVVFNRQTQRIPDQVTHRLRSTCLRSTIHTVYAGRKSYQSSVASSVFGAGTYMAYAFTASTAMSQAERASKTSQRLIVENKQTCSYGSLRLQTQMSGINIDAGFYRAVAALPMVYNQAQYFRFLDIWGTHITSAATLGTKTITRYQMPYANAFKTLQRSTSSAARASISTPLTSGSMTLSLTPSAKSALFSSSLKTRITGFTVGQTARPIPTVVTVIPIYSALLKKYWQPWSCQYSSMKVATKYSNLIRAFNAYRARGRLAVDPAIRLVVTWPMSNYGFPEPRTGCPTGFLRGCRSQDNENTNNKNAFSNTAFLSGRFSSDITMCYCMKKQATAFPWQPGTYCINRYTSGARCPAGFSNGWIRWDDENCHNKNQKSGYLPYGVYNADTTMWYCCRSDGRHNVPIYLPTVKPFVLYMHKSYGCQQVRGMRYRIIRVKTDDENKNGRNIDHCQGTVPYDRGCTTNHDVYMCYYFR